MPICRSERMEDVTFIIPTLPGGHPARAIAQILQLNYPLDSIEILVAKGKSPSLQRNEAAARAKGEFLYFLDDDSYIDPDALTAALKYFKQKEVAAVGGPALTYDEASHLERYFGAAAGSGFGTGPARARSRITGEPREVRGEELILCNLLMRKDAFLAHSGFNIALYPNEENELLKRLRRRGHRFYYVPEMIVRRPRRKVLGEFVKQMRSYGNGRAQHLLKGFTLQDLIFFVPSLFVLYLFCLPFLSISYSYAPLYAYLFLACGAAIKSAARHRDVRFCLALPCLFPVMHIAYGIGILEGLILQKQKSLFSEEILVDPVKALSGLS